MGKTFISYARTDQEFVLKLAQDLRAAGADIWIDKLDIPTGANWVRSIQEALENCTSLIVVLSKASVNSDNVLDEVLFAREEKKAIYPVLYESCKRPFHLRARQYSDFTQNYENGMEKLLSVLNISAPKTQLPPEPKPVQQRLQQRKPKAAPASSGKIPARLSFRATPNEYLSVDDVKSMLKKQGFFDSKLNKTGKGIQHAFEKQAKGKIVFDSTTGLYWQQSGSSDRMNFKDAQAYISKLNAENYGGYNDWRLPTLEEAMSLMEPEEKNDDLSIDPIYDNKQTWIWTSSIDDAGLVWFVYFRDGFCGSFPRYYGSFFYVRAVRS